MTPGDLVQHIQDEDIGIVLKVRDDPWRADWTVFIQFFGPDKECDWYNPTFVKVISETR